MLFYELSYQIERLARRRCAFQRKPQKVHAGQARLRIRNLREHGFVADYDAALGEVEKLWGSKVGTADGDRLDVLLVLIDDYESKHHPIDPPDAVDAIKFRMEQMNLTRKDLEPLIGPRGRVAEVLNRRRPLSLSMIRSLHHKLHIPLESLIATSGALAANKRMQRMRQSVAPLRRAADARRSAATQGYRVTI